MFVCVRHFVSLFADTEGMSKADETPFTAEKSGVFMGCPSGQAPDRLPLGAEQVNYSHSLAHRGSDTHV